VLTHSASQKVIDQVNTARALFSGNNKRPLPAGQVTVQSNGHLTLAASGGRQYGLRPNGTLASFKDSQGTRATYGSNGQLRSVQTKDSKIIFGRAGGRIVIKQLPNHMTAVSFDRHSGYIQSTIVRGNSKSVQRTYIVHGQTFVRSYAPYSYRSLELVVYKPSIIYAPTFYGWLYYPWESPATYTWDWANDPWYTAYESYFAPLPAYSSATLWMTDFILGSTLAAAYEQQQDFPATQEDGGAAPVEAEAQDTPSESETYAQNPGPITPQLRAAFAEQVREETAEENAVATNQASPDVQQLPSNLERNHLFLVADILYVSSDQGNCWLNGGDLIGVVDPSGSSSDTALMSVLSSKRGDCPVGASADVRLEDLQEMDNNLRLHMDNAIAQLHSNQGQGGLPAAPHSAIAPPPRSAMDDVPGVPNAATILADAEQSSSDEKDKVIREAFSQGN